MLNSLSKDDGMLFELEHEGGCTVRAMSRWNYKNQNIIEVRYEEIIANEDEWFRRIFTQYGFDEVCMHEAVDIAKKFGFKEMTGRSLGEEDRSSYMRKGSPGDWKNHFTARHKERFKELFPDALQKLEYEKSCDW